MNNIVNYAGEDFDNETVSQKGLGQSQEKI